MTERDLSSVDDDGPDYIELMDRYEDVYDPRNPWCLGGYPRRDQFVDGLRKLADLLASRHDLPIPKDGSLRLDVIEDERGHVGEITFGPVSYRFTTVPSVFEQATDPGSADCDAVRLAARDIQAKSRHTGFDTNPLAATAPMKMPRPQHTSPKTKRRAR